MSVSEELVQLLESVIPDCRKQLRDSHNNLEKVAIYCEGNYVQATDKRAVLEETKNYTTQSLASVAYQINTLATNFLRLLDLQMGQISDMESNINHLNQIVMIHKEKVARREIGELTANKSITRPPGVKNPGIIFPEQQEKSLKYIRTPIDFSLLDGIGHGVKSGNNNNNTTTSSRNSTSSAGSKMSTNSMPPHHNNHPSNINYPSTQQPTNNNYPPTPPANYPTGSLRRPNSNISNSGNSYPPPPSNQGQYRPGMYTGETQSPNMVPSNNLPQHVGSNGTYAPSLMRNPSQQQQQQQMQQQQLQQQQLQQQQMFMSDAFATNTPTRHLPPDQYMGNTSPPLPPPPSMNFTTQMTTGGYPGSHTNQDWVPANYIEKVVAMYSYQQDKEDELTFDEGAVIYVVKKNDDNWWEGVMDGQTGLFPGNYVEPCI